MGRTAWTSPVFGVLVMIACAVPAQAQTLDDAFYALQKALNALNAKGVATDKTPVTPTESLDDSVNALMSLTSSLPQAQQGLYARTLAYDADLLNQAASATGLQRAELIADVAADLRVKLSGADSLGLGSRFNGLVSVHVRTFRGGAEVKGYVVRLNPVRYRESSPFIRFPNLSSPASGEAAPGRYEIQIERQGAIVTRDVVEIGLNAKDVTDLDIALP